MMLWLRNPNQYHVVQVKFEQREDVYGQNFKATCKCGISSGWHTLPQWARHAVYQNHEHIKDKMVI